MLIPFYSDVLEFRRIVDGEKVRDLRVDPEIGGRVAALLVKAADLLPDAVGLIDIDVGVLNAVVQRTGLQARAVGQQIEAARSTGSH